MINTEEIIRRCKDTHGEEFDYSKTKYTGSKNKIVVTCRKHGDFLISPRHHAAGQKCPKCPKPNSRTNEEFIKESKKVHGGEFDYSKTEYLGTKQKIILICSKGHEVSVFPDNHLRGFGCKKCSGVHQKTQKEFIEKASRVHANLYIYDNVKYVRCDKKISITCEKHGDFIQTPASHLAGRGCPKCRGMYKTTEDIIKEFKKVHGFKYDYSKVNYINNSSKVTIVCKKHGEFKQVPYSHTNGSGCPACVGKVKQTTESFKTKAASRHKNKYSYDKSEFKGSHIPLIVTCEEHGDFMTTPGNHLAGKGCPKCNYQVSSQEELLIKEFPIFKQTNKSILYPRHLDLYSDKHRLAVEINGRYWHSEQNGKSSTYHLTKTEDCLAKKITLLHFWENEVDSKFNIIKSMISSKLGGSEKVHGRNTKLITPTKQEVKEFLDVNHLQGDLPYKKAYGLVLEGQLVSLMTFGKPRYNKQYEWEILRYTTKLGFTVVGGASKLFSAFIKDCSPKSIITYADRRYSEGEVYEKLGLQFSHNSRPNYFYAKGSTSIPRYMAQKHKLPKLLGDKFNPHLSETQNMLNNGYVKVWDCGNKVFVKSFN